MRVLVTRPRPDAERTAARLAALGHEPIVVPLQDILPLPDAGVPATVDAVAVTSANALRQAAPALVRMLAAKPCFAVGRQTASVARDCGFGDVREGPGEAAGLAGFVGSALRQGSRLAYLCGRKRKDVLEHMLADAGVVVTPVETYDTVERTPRPEELAAAAGAGAALVYSAGAARRLAAAFAGKPAPARLIAISPDAAAALPQDWRMRAIVADRPDEDAMLEALAAL